MHWVSISVDPEFDESGDSKGEILLIIVRESFSFDQKIHNSLPGGLVEIPVVVGIEEVSLVSRERGKKDVL